VSAATQKTFTPGDITVQSQRSPVPQNQIHNLRNTSMNTVSDVPVWAVGDSAGGVVLGRIVENYRSTNALFNQWEQTRSAYSFALIQDGMLALRNISSAILFLLASLNFIFHLPGPLIS
jgi:hypothetical protein